MTKASKPLRAAACAVVLVLCAFFMPACDKKTEKDEQALSLNRVLEACLVAEICLGDTTGKEECLLAYLLAAGYPAENMEEIDTLYRCLADSSSCGDAAACRISDCSFGTTGCEGDILIGCVYPGFEIQKDCELENKHCLVNLDLAADCATDECDSEDEGWWCEGDELVSCVSGVLSRTDCRTEVADGICVESSGPLCISAPETPCDEGTFEERCNGDQIVTCRQGFVARLRCLDLLPYSTGCQERDGSVYCALSDLPCGEIPPHQCVCSGPVLRCCIFDLLQEIDCRLYDAECVTDEDLGTSFCSSADR